jgi:hypothetical protein
VIDENFTGTFHDGDFIPADPFKWADVAGKCEDEAVIVTVQKYYGARSSAQNRYYFGVVVELISDHTGYRPDEVHDAIKMKFLIKPAEEGKPTTLRSTSSLNTAQFEELMTQVREWASQEMGLFIPAPNEQMDVPF